MTVREQLVEARAAELLTVKEYARLERISIRTIRRRLAAGTQRGAVRCGGQWRIDVTVAFAPRAGATASADGNPSLA